MEQFAHEAGRKIRAWREQHGLSAAELGERLDPQGKGPVPPHTIYGWELRGKIARRRHQVRLADMGVCDAADWLQAAELAA